MSAHPLPNKGVGEYIHNLAAQHNIGYIMTVGDSIANAFTRLSDDDLEMDEVELLLIALERAGVVQECDVIPLHINYLREKFNVRPI